MAAAQLKAFAGSDAAALRLARRALARLEPIHGPRMGIDVPDLARRVRARFEGGAAIDLSIRLDPP